MDNPDRPEGQDTPLGSQPQQPQVSPPLPEPPLYSPPPTSIPAPLPPAYAQQFGAPYAPYAPPPQAAPRRRGSTLLIVGIIVVVLLAALGGGAALANASLSSTYSPQKAVSDYFAAMTRGDVNGMMSNATFLTGDGTYSQLFEKDSVTAMLRSEQNKQISKVSVGTPSRLDDATSSVTVSMSWGGTPRTLTYQVRKDPARVHFLLYDSWRVQVPYMTITMGLPNQAGVVQVDGIAVQAAASSKKAEVIQGFHSVTMEATDFYASSSQLADAVDGSPTITFASNLRPSATDAATGSIKAAFANITCDAGKYFDCPNHQYRTKAGYSYTELEGLPGGNIDAVSWVWTITGDPTANMKLTVSTTSGEVDGAGVCTEKLTVNGNRVYNFTGVWTAVLSWGNGAFDSDVQIDCAVSRA